MSEITFPAPRHAVTPAVFGPGNSGMSEQQKQMQYFAYGATNDVTRLASEIHSAARLEIDELQRLQATLEAGNFNPWYTTGGSKIEEKIHEMQAAQRRLDDIHEVLAAPSAPPVVVELSNPKILEYFQTLISAEEAKIGDACDDADRGRNVEIRRGGELKISKAAGRKELLLKIMADLSIKEEGEETE